MARPELEKLVESRKAELRALGVCQRLELWLKLHKRSERWHIALGIVGIISAAVSSQLSGYPQVLLFTGLLAAISTALLTFLNMRLRSIIYINAWRMLDKEVTNYLCDRDGKCTIEDVGKARNIAEEYIQQALHRVN